MKGQGKNRMKIVSPSKVRYGNYLFPIKAQSHTENLQKLLIQFSKRKFSPAAVCSVPQYWAKAIRLSLMKMLEIDPEIEIGHIKERSGRLSINIFTVTVNAEKLLSIDDLIWGRKTWRHMKWMDYDNAPVPVTCNIPGCVANHKDQCHKRLHDPKPRLRATQ